jgi:hypothetical protein
MFTDKKSKDRVGKKFASRHWKMIIVFILGCILAVAGAVYVFQWHAEEAQVSGLVPGSLNQWSVGHMFDFFLHLLFWEAILVGIPVIVAFVAGYMLWYRKLPAAERAEYERHKIFSSSDKSKGGGGISAFIHILFLLKVQMDGNWWSPFSTWSFDYVIETGLWALMWVFIIAAIPLTLGAIWWFTSGMKKFGTCNEESNTSNGPE